MVFSFHPNKNVHLFEGESALELTIKLISPLLYLNELASEMKHIFLGFQIILNKIFHAIFYSSPIYTQIKQSPQLVLSAILLREIKACCRK